MYGPVHAYPPGAPPSAVTERAGPGLALVGAGIVAGLLSLLALPWAEGAGDATFMDIRDALSEAPEPTEVVPDVAWWYVNWLGLTTFAVVVVLAVVAAIGLRSGATIVARTLTVVAALGAFAVHYMGVWQLFEYGGEAADAGPLVMYAAYALLLAGGALGPRRVPVGPAPGPPAPMAGPVPAPWPDPAAPPR